MAHKMLLQRGYAQWGVDKYGPALIYADGKSCGIMPFMDDFDKDKPCGWCGRRLGTGIKYDYETKQMFHHWCYGLWIADGVLKGLDNE